MTTTIVRIVLLALAVGLVLLTGAASGAPEKATRTGIPNARGVYSGCYQQVTGDLRVIPGSKGCRAGESRVTWNREGQRGPAGPQGPVGDTRTPRPDWTDRRAWTDGFERPSRAPGEPGASGTGGRSGPSGAGRPARPSRS